jgi:hypothetical protein
MPEVQERIGWSRSFAALRAYVRKPHIDSESCDLCAKIISSDHEHLLDLSARKIVCACEACAILFGSQATPHYRRVSRDAWKLPEFAIDDHEWESLLIPINLAYFSYNSAAGRVVAQYPSPAGPMESLLDLEYWGAIVDRNPTLKNLQPDVEALLVNRIADPAQYYIVPIDVCFRLVGLIRSHWRGLSGGSDVWKEVTSFFERLTRTGKVRRA